MSLFSPVKLNELTLQNRIIIPPMCQYSAIDGQAQPWHHAHYGGLAHSGAGMLIIEATAVCPEGRISPYDLGLWDESTKEAQAGLLKGLRQHSAMPVAVQLAHAGRKASVGRPWQGDKTLSATEGGWRPVAPSPIAYKGQDAPPHELTPGEINEVVKAFTQAARRADKAGFDCIELHCAHGYLLHEFLSPVSNKRGDNYGGPLAKRMRLPLEVFAAIREEFPRNKPVGVRISGSDWVEGGWNVEESAVFGRELAGLGCDYIHVSGGGLSLEQKLVLGAGYQTGMAATIKRETGMPTIAVGLITEAQQAEHIIVTGQADMVAIGRAMIYNPRWPWHAAAELGAQVAAPPQYWRSQPRGFKNLFKNF